MDDLADFIAARLNEDEAMANAAWYEKDRLTFKEVPRQQNANWDASDISIVGPNGPAHHISAHVARHDPARVLREVAAKRAIVARYGRGAAGDLPEWTAGRELIVAGLAILEGVLRDLAVAWSDHPDYRPEWAPS